MSRLNDIFPSICSKVETEDQGDKGYVVKVNGGTWVQGLTYRQAQDTVNAIRVAERHSTRSLQHRVRALLGLD